MAVEASNPTPSWDLAHDFSQLVEFHFMVNALLAGAIVAVLAAAVGWLMVLRGEAFAGHTLSMMAFPGAAGAALLAVPAAWGYYVFCAGGAVAIASASGAERGGFSGRSAAIGSVQALTLGIGFLFVSLYGGVLGDLENLLFGNPLGVSDGELLTLGLVAAATLATLAGFARPLLFASVDPAVAAARGVPVARLTLCFLLLLGLTVAATSQITGVLLVFTLLLAPAATAQTLTARPLMSLALSVVLALLIVWLGLAVAYFSPYPAGFFIAAISFALYVIARLVALAREGYAHRRRPPVEPRPEPAGVIA